MSQGLTTFNFKSTPIRIVYQGNDPWFVGADACRCLGCEIGTAHGGTGRHLRSLKADERRTLRRAVEPEVPLFANTQASAVTLISESGLYKLIMRSDKSQAREFQDWVTRTVLPAIRKDGAYIMGEEKVASGERSEDKFVLKVPELLPVKIVAKNLAKSARLILLQPVVRHLQALVLSKQRDHSF